MTRFLAAMQHRPYAVGHLSSGTEARVVITGRSNLFCPKKLPRRYKKIAKARAEGLGRDGRQAERKRALFRRIEHLASRCYAILVSVNRDTERLLGRSTKAICDLDREVGDSGCGGSGNFPGSGIY
jgi:hypothetical protein